MRKHNYDGDQFIRLLLNYSSDQAEFLSLSTEAFFSLLIMFQTTEKMVGLWLVILTSSASIALHESKNFLSDPDLKFRNFAKKIDGRILNGSFVKELNVTSQIFCQIECVTDSRCLSYNLVPIPGMEMSVCQLNHGDIDLWAIRISLTKMEQYIEEYRSVNREAD